MTQYAWASGSGLVGTFDVPCFVLAVPNVPAVQQSIDTAWPPGPQQQTRRSGMQRPNDATDGQTDGRTPDSFIDPAART